MCNIKISIFSALILLTLSQTALAEEESIPNWKEDTLTGAWGGARTELYKQGIDIGLTHKSDVLANISGGIKRGAVWMGHTEAQVTIDLDKLFGWQSATAFVHYHSDLGSKFNTHYVGGFVGEDNIEVASNTAQFYQAWVQKNWLDNHLSVLAGLYAVDTEFYVNDSSGVFMQAPYGMANEVAQSGVAGPAIFPLGALGVRVKYTTLNEKFYVQGAITDGVPGDPNNPRGTHIKLGNGDGTFSILEFGYTPKYESLSNDLGKDASTTNFINKSAIGFWRFSHRLDDLVSLDSSGSPKKHASQGVYFLTEHTLMLEQANLEQGLTGFMRLGFASEDVHEADWSSSLGLHYIGLINGRNEDVAGVALTYNHVSDKYQALNDSKQQEIDLEVTYKAQIKPWLSLQPNFQYIINPGMDKTLKNAAIIGFRTEISF